MNTARIVARNGTLFLRSTWTTLHTFPILLRWEPPRRSGSHYRLSPDKGFGHDRRSCRGSKRGARSCVSKTEKKLLRVRRDLAWHGARTRDTRWRTRKASASLMWDACARSFRSVPARFDSTRLDSPRFGSVRLGSLAARERRSVRLARLGTKSGSKPRSSNEKRAWRRRPDLYECYAWWRADDRRKRIAAGVRDSWADVTGRSVRSVYYRRTNSSCECR